MRPRATVRRGPVKVGERVRLGDGRVNVEQVDCAGDSIRITLAVEPPSELAVRLTADGRRLDVLEVEIDEDTGRGRVTAYPLMRSDEMLRIGLKGRGRGAEASIDVPLL